MSICTVIFGGETKMPFRIAGDERDEPDATFQLDIDAFGEDPRIDHSYITDQRASAPRIIFVMGEPIAYREVRAVVQDQPPDAGFHVVLGFDCPAETQSSGMARKGSAEFIGRLIRNNRELARENWTGRLSGVSA